MIDLEHRTTLGNHWDHIVTHHYQWLPSALLPALYSLHFQCSQDLEFVIAAEALGNLNMWAVKRSSGES